LSARVVAFLNFKGGVGKTANVVNIGASLAQTHGKRVLVVDLDAQCNASYWLLGKNRWRQHTEDRKRTVYQLFSDKLKGTKLFRFKDAIVRGVPLSADGFPQIPSLDVLPAVVELLTLEQELGAKPLSSYQFLRQQLQHPVDSYDYVLLDCPPNFFMFTKNAVFFADHVAVPYIPDFLSLAGFRQLAELVERFGKQIGGNKTALGATRISAIVVNRYARNGNVFQQGLVELERLIGRLQSEQLIHPRTCLLQPPIRSCVKVAEAPAVHLPVLLHAPSSIGATDYEALTRSFLTHYEGLK
jgi:chromosome partitioning protein